MVKIGYVRVSRETQDPEYQIALMEKEGIAKNDIFVDHGFSGWSDPTIRPVYKKLLERIKVGDITEILFSEFSRLGRNAKESMYELLRLEHLGIRVQSLSEHESFLNNLPGAQQVQILSGFMAGAEMQLAHIRENTKRGLDRVRERGSKSGKPMGRPRVIIDWEKVSKTMEQYKVSEKIASRICGYNESTFYKAKKERKLG